MSKRNGKTELEDFATGIENRLRKGDSPMTLQRLACRLLTGKDEKIAAALLVRVVEWRYGKPREKLEHSGPDGGPMQVVMHTIRFGDGDSEAK